MFTIPLFVCSLYNIRVEYTPQDIVGIVIVWLLVRNNNYILAISSPLLKNDVFASKLWIVPSYIFDSDLLGIVFQSLHFVFNIIIHFNKYFA